MKQLLVFLFLLCSASISAQDVIVKKDGSTIVCRVVELTSSDITYKKWSDLNGSNYVMNRADASAINYQNGKRVDLSEATNLYTPHNQNDGVQQYNDRALLGMDYSNNRIEKQIKRLHTWGWISGIGGLGIGLLMANLGNNSDDEGVGYYISSGIFVIGGITSSICCFVSAHKKKKEAEMYLQSSTLYQYDFKIGNYSSLSASVDILRDQTFNNNTLGLGLRYNF